MKANESRWDVTAMWLLSMPLLAEWVYNDHWSIEPLKRRISLYYTEYEICLTASQIGHTIEMGGMVLKHIDR